MHTQENETRKELVKHVNKLFDYMVYSKEKFSREDDVTSLPDELYGEVVLTAISNVMRFFLVSHLAPYSRDEVWDNIYQGIKESFKLEPDANKTKEELDAEKEAAAEKARLSVIETSPEIVIPN